MSFSQEKEAMRPFRNRFRSLFKNRSTYMQKCSPYRGRFVWNLTGAKWKRSTLVEAQSQGKLVVKK